jgi:hypothetical protein
MGKRILTNIHILGVSFWRHLCYNVTTSAVYYKIDNCFATVSPEVSAMKNDEMNKKVKTLLFGKIYWDDISKVLDEVNSNSNKKHLLEDIETGEGKLLPMYDFDDDSEDSDDGCRCDSIIKEENDMCYVKEDECNSSFENECLVF